jgi:hypothetical protein
MDSGTKQRSKLPWAAAIILVVIAGTAACNVRPSEAPPALEAPPDLALSSFSHVLPEGQQFTLVGSPLMALSPDGSRMVYVANQQFYMLAMDTLVSSPIPGSDVDPSDPFFSPDGAWIGYWSEADSQLKKIAVSGGTPVTLTDTVGDPTGRPFWGADEIIVWGQNETVMQVSANGGPPEVLIEDTGASLTYGPRILPDQRSVLFQAEGPVEGDVVVQSLESGERKVLFPGLFPRYLPTGHLLYGLDDVLFAVGFDLTTLEAVGEPVTLFEGVRTRPSQYAVSESGSFAWVPGNGQTDAGEASRSQINVVLNWFEELTERAPVP